MCAAMVNCRWGWGSGKDTPVTMDSGQISASPAATKKRYSQRTFFRYRYSPRHTSAVTTMTTG